MKAEPSWNELVFGKDSTAGIVAIEPIADEKHDRMRVYRRDPDGVTFTDYPFSPYLWARDADLLSEAEADRAVEKLDGRNPLQMLARFHTWKAFTSALAHLKKVTGRSVTASDAPYFAVRDPVQQFLMDTGMTLFKDIPFEGVRRMQVDIETHTTEGYVFCNATREGDRIIAMSLADSTGWTEVISVKDMSEADLLRRFVELVQERDPDVIEGHNLFRFDLPYIETRARRHQVALKLGRDGSAMRQQPGRLVVADRSISYAKAKIFGRHIVDTYFFFLLYDVTHRSLDGFGLKAVARHFGIAAEHRTYIPGDEIAAEFERNPDRVLAYARDDILETRALADLLSPVYYTQAQLLPMGYQDICVRGNAAKIDALMLRAYLAEKRSIPFPDPPKAFSGGYTDMFYEGVAEPVHHVDVRSLYPSLMLKDELKPATDEAGVFLKLLDYLRGFRLEAKQAGQKAKSSGERVYQDALSTTYKVLINSFYGYLGFRHARFSDFSVAAQVTEKGRALLRQMIDWLKAHEAIPIEIDTDGIYFMPPTFSNDAEKEQFQRSFQADLPEGIEVEFDGEYRAMFSYKMKNYALLEKQGEVIIKGAALKSRGLEPFQRDFLKELLRLRLERRDDELPKLKERYRRAIEHHDWPIRRLAKTETLKESPKTYAEKIKQKGRGRNAAYELALQSGRDFDAGDQISYYVTGTKKTVAVHASAKLVTDWDPHKRDENVAYYLAKLDALYKKFAPGPEQGMLGL